MKRSVLLLLVIGLLVETTSCIRKKPKQESLKCGVQEQATCGDLGSVGPPPQFKAFCATCHQFDRSGTGTALQGMMKRVPSREWLLSYLQNEDSLIQSGDTTAIRISRILPAGPCHKFSNLTDDHLGEIIRYTEQ